MKEEYTCKFINDEDGTSIERKFKLINHTTIKARSLVKRLITINGDQVIENSDAINKLYEDSNYINEFMRFILIGDHEGIDWFTCESATQDVILSDFFMSFVPKT